MYIQQIFIAINIFLFVLNILAIIFLHPYLYERRKIAEDNRKNNSMIISLVKMKLGNEAVSLYRHSERHYVFFGEGEIDYKKAIQVDEENYNDLLKIIKDYKLQSLYDKALDSEYKKVVG